MTEKEKKFVEDAKFMGISHYKKSLEEFRNGEKQILYVAATPFAYDYKGFHRGTVRAYVWTEQNGWRMLFYNLSPARAKAYLKAFRANKLEDISPVVVNNYITNGYSTRSGLFADYSSDKIERMKVVAQSHSNDGELTGMSSIEAHNYRVALRN